MTTAPATRDGSAARSIASPDLMQAFQDGLPVRLIATPRAALATCRADERLRDVVARNTEGYDFFPVTEPAAGAQDRIIGLVELARFRGRDAPAKPVRAHLRTLDEDTLIGADAGILSFLKDADARPCRLVVAGSRIDGLVSWSDMQKLPVRAALFALITQLEMTMAEAIERDCPDARAWKARLSAKDRRRVEAKIGAARTDDHWVNDLLFTQFLDKVTILARSPSRGCDGQAFKETMEAVRDLRNRLAHANDYAQSRDAAAAVGARVREIERWIDALGRWPHAAKGG
ncbi:hypothetical protein [Elioraea sp.]|uniref:hypothetical protein n=1 Tax=Elioraea sp. TaxID=2185103 RepID=UPI003F6EB53F